MASSLSTTPCSMNINATALKYLTDISQVVFVVDGDKLKVHLILPDGMDSEPLRVMNYRYGSLGMDEIMVAENGAVLTRDAYGNIVHAGSIYPRLPGSR